MPEKNIILVYLEKVDKLVENPTIWFHLRLIKTIKYSLYKVFMFESGFGPD